ncbi:hypothetical protein [Amycolatopsis sp. cmx-4-54]|uniref:hypothetical protein n=1 Tax=Amycolatopsis sp. cmx-4-54 TaxID=2790936 RepID=UPI00397D85DA
MKRADRPLTRDDLEVDPPEGHDQGRPEPRFGVYSVSWSDAKNQMYPLPDEDGRGQPDDSSADEMNRLRGLIMVQAAETEAVLGEVLLHLDPEAKPGKMMAGSLFNAVWDALLDSDRHYWEYELYWIRQAQKLRNRAVHHRPVVGFSWRDYSSGAGGEWVPVISFLGYEAKKPGEKSAIPKIYNEQDLLGDLAEQQTAMAFAIEILHRLKCPGHDAEDGCPHAW